MMMKYASPQSQEDSLFCESQAPVVVVDPHYRCVGEVAAWLRRGVFPLYLLSLSTSSSQQTCFKQFVIICVTDIVASYLADWCSGNAVDFYLESARLESRAGLSEGPRGIPQSPDNSGMVVRLGYDRFLPDLIQFIIQQSPYHSTLYSVKYWYHCKMNHKKG
jgi:hypothetical protein